jgi:ribosome-associated toxin RatA of RatAB toxin-antitoxin module
MTKHPARALELGPLPLGRRMEIVDERLVRASVQITFDIARKVENWPAHLSHYRYVRFRERQSDGGGVVEMSANRPFAIVDTPKGPWRLDWPTWWLSEMSANRAQPSIRFRHIEGITKGMEVEWTFTPERSGTHVQIIHVWDGPRIPLIGNWAAMYLIGPVFVHGIASRTLAGLAAVAEREAHNSGDSRDRWIDAE